VALSQHQPTSVERRLVALSDNTGGRAGCSLDRPHLERRKRDKTLAAVPLPNNVSTFRRFAARGDGAGCRCSARAGPRFASAVGQRFNVSRGWGLIAISSHRRCRTTFQRFAATGSDRDDHNNGYSRYWPRPAPTGCRSSNRKRHRRDGDDLEQKQPIPSRTDQRNELRTIDTTRTVVDVRAQRGERLEVRTFRKRRPAPKTVARES
jgi:hypothetical protein